MRANKLAKARHDLGAETRAVEDAVMTDIGLHITLAQSVVPEDGALRTAVYGYKNENEN